MTLPRVSIITPTRNRAPFLPRIARCVLSQTVPWEWWVHDDSAEPDPYMQALARDDGRIHYLHSSAPASIGAKRNAMIAAASAPHIAHFDDDDVYSPVYLEHMLNILGHTRADMLKLSAFYIYAPVSDFLGYLDLNATAGWHYEITADGFKPHDFSGENKVGDDFIVFYGFSYVYRRDPALGLPYEDISLYEDARFSEAWVKGGRSIATTTFTARDCVHWVHPSSTARSFSGYRIPSFLLPDLFPFCARLNQEFPQLLPGHQPGPAGAGAGQGRQGRQGGQGATG